MLLRLNTGVRAETHAHVRTGGDDTKFGIHRRDEEAAAEALRAHRSLDFAGLHAHAGSSIADPATFATHARALAEAAARFDARGFPVREIVAGGGFGAALDLRETIAGMVRAIAQVCEAAGVARPRIGIEPGRAIVARAGTSLYRVVAIKRQESRTFVVIDGGLADNPRPAIYGATHAAYSAERPERRDCEVTLCGRSCENDELGPAWLPSDLHLGELLAMEATGAYTFSMASNYNRFPRPAVVAVAAGRARTLVRRESLEELLRTDEA